MKIGDIVEVQRPYQYTRERYEEWRIKYGANCGIVEYISPHRWVSVVMFSRKTGKPLYLSLIHI